MTDIYLQISCAHGQLHLRAPGSGIHDGKISHAEEDHAKHVEQHAKKLAQLNDKKRFKKKKDLRAEAEKMGVDVKVFHPYYHISLQLGACVNSPICVYLRGHRA